MQALSDEQQMERLEKKVDDGFERMERKMDEGLAELRGEAKADFRLLIGLLLGLYATILLGGPHVLGVF